MRPAITIVAAVLLSRGSAQAQLVFTPPETLFSSIPGVLAPLSHGIGDVDGDGRDDYVLQVGIDLRGTHVFLNGGAAGGGALTALPTQQLGAVDTLLAMGDLDGDGLLDLALSDVPPAGGSAKVWVALGTGGGIFAPAAPTPSTIGADIGALSDLDGDGVLDLVLGRASGSSFSYEILIGMGDGSFVSGVSPPPIPTGLFGMFEFLELSDVDGDGHADIFSGHANGLLSITWGTGGGLFSATPTQGSTGVATIFGDQTAADFDGDGVLDVAAIGGGDLQLQFGHSDGSFDAPLFTPQPASSSAALLPADVDGDGLLDLCLANTPSPYAVTILWGAGDGTFVQDVSVTTHAPVSDLVALDADEDGLAEIAGIGAVSGFAGWASWLLPNASYDAGSAWLDLGGALPGSVGYPILLGSGPLTSGTPYALDLFNGVPGSTPILVVGLSLAGVPLLGGLLIPSPDLLLNAPPVDASGNSTLAGTVPAVAAGFNLWAQAWMSDPAGPSGWAATSGIVASFTP